VLGVGLKVFYELINILQKEEEQDSREVKLEEQLAIFLY
jgi:hypothetical protein